MADSFSSVEHALRLAAESSSDALLPCPLCAASLKATNLEKHLEKVHAGEERTATSWAGSDRAIGRVLIVYFILCVASIGLFSVVPQAAATVLATVLAVAMLVFMGLLVAMVADKLPATLCIEDRRVVVRYAFGLLSRSVQLPPRVIEVGTLVETRSDPTVPTRYQYGGTDVKMGTYLRLRDDGGGMVTVGAKTGSKLRKHWEGWTHGGKVRLWDILVSPSALVALEYLLWSRGQLTPRAPGAD